MECHPGGSLVTPSPGSGSPGDQRGQSGQVSELEVGRGHAGAPLPAIAVDPRDAQPRGASPLDIVDVAVADVQHLVRFEPEPLEGSLEHARIGLVRAEGLRDQDELDGQ